MDPAGQTTVTKFTKVPPDSLCRDGKARCERFHIHFSNGAEFLNYLFLPFIQRHPATLSNQLFRSIFHFFCRCSTNISSVGIAT
jgi:hypothetical protein